jgi:hypothetical protein
MQLTVIFLRELADIFEHEYLNGGNMSSGDFQKLASTTGKDHHHHPLHISSFECITHLLLADTSKSRGM